MTEIAGVKSASTWLFPVGDEAEGMWSKVTQGLPREAISLCVSKGVPYTGAADAVEMLRTCSGNKVQRSF